VVKKIREILDELGLKYRYVDKDKLFVIPVTTEARKFNVLIMVRGDWITTVALAAKKEELPKDLDEREFFRTLLRLSLELSEVTYGLTELGDVVVHAETHVRALSKENFKIELASVMFGVDYFAKEVATKYPRVRVPDEVTRKIYYYIA